MGKDVKLGSTDAPMDLREPANMKKLMEFAASLPRQCPGSTCNGNEPSEKPHLCPFQVDVHDDSEFLCSCCAECQTACAAAV